MQFFSLPEPHISSSHVLMRTPLLYRLDARSPTASVVFNEYVDKAPMIEVHGDSMQARRLLDAVFPSLQQLSIRYHREIDDDLAPLYTLDLRGSPEQQTLITGFPDGRAKIVVYGLYKASQLISDVWSVRIRLLELSALYFGP